MPRATIKDVARAAGVSVATVSRALSGARGVTRENLALVLHAVEQLDYQPNAIAQSLRRSRTHAIGMVVPKIDNPFFPQVVAEVERQLQSHGYSLLLCSSDGDPKAEAGRLRLLAERQVDGLIVVPTSQQESAAALSSVSQRVPIVQLDQRAPSVRTGFVGVDDASGIRQVVDHLRRSGRRDLAFIGAVQDNWSGGRRWEGFVRWGIAADPRAADRIRLGAFTRGFGYEAAGDILDHESVDAIVCANDLIAIGALDAARERGLGVPAQLHITGFDDIDIASIYSPSLTTVRQPVAALVSAAVEQLLRQIDGATEVGDLVELPVELVVRESSPALS